MTYFIIGIVIAAIYFIVAISNIMLEFTENLAFVFWEDIDFEQDSFRIALLATTLSLIILIIWPLIIIPAIIYLIKILMPYFKS